MPNNSKQRRLAAKGAKDARPTFMRFSQLPWTNRPRGSPLSPKKNADYSPCDAEDTGAWPPLPSNANISSDTGSVASACSASQASVASPSSTALSLPPVPSLAVGSHSGNPYFGFGPALQRPYSVPVSHKPAGRPACKAIVQIKIPDPSIISASQDGEIQIQPGDLQKMLDSLHLLHSASPPAVSPPPAADLANQSMPSSHSSHYRATSAGISSSSLSSPATPALLSPTLSAAPLPPPHYSDISSASSCSIPGLSPSSIHFSASHPTPPPLCSLVCSSSTSSTIAPSLPGATAGHPPLLSVDPAAIECQLGVPEPQPSPIGIRVDSAHHNSRSPPGRRPDSAPLRGPTVALPFQQRAQWSPPLPSGCDVDLQHFDVRSAPLDRPVITNLLFRKCTHPRQGASVRKRPATSALKLHKVPARRPRAAAKEHLPPIDAAGDLDPNLAFTLPGRKRRCAAIDSPPNFSIKTHNTFTALSDDHYIGPLAPVSGAVNVTPTPQPSRKRCRTKARKNRTPLPATPAPLIFSSTPAAVTTSGPSPSRSARTFSSHHHSTGSPPLASDALSPTRSPHSAVSPAVDPVVVCSLPASLPKSPVTSGLSPSRPALTVGSPHHSSLSPPPDSVVHAPNLPPCSDISAVDPIIACSVPTISLPKSSVSSISDIPPTSRPNLDCLFASSSSQPVSQFLDLSLKCYSGFRWSSFADPCFPPQKPALKTTLSLEDIDSLLPGKWLSDSVIASAIGPHLPDDGYLIPTALSVATLSYDPDARNLVPVLPDGATKLFWPVLLPNSHFVLLYLDTVSKTYTTLDPIHRKGLGSYRTQETLLVKSLSGWLNLPPSPPFRRVNAPAKSQQLNGSDCGLFIIKFGILFCRNPFKVCHFSNQAICDLRSSLARKSLAAFAAENFRSLLETQPAISCHSATPPTSQDKPVTACLEPAGDSSELDLLSKFTSIDRPGDIYTAITTHFFPNKNTNLVVNKVGDSSMSAQRLQRTFEEHPRRAMRHILPEAMPRTAPTLDCITDYFGNKVCSSDTVPLRLPDISFFQEKDCSITSPILPKELTNYLLTRPNSSPGHENISYCQWRSVPPKILCHLFNSIIATSEVPETWKSYRTILIPKPEKDDYDSINSWRPISLLPASYKIFAGILARRLTPWIKQEHISKCQKALLHSEGTIEHAFTSQVIIDDAYRNKKPLSMVWLDIADAFGSIPHDLLFELLHSLGLDDPSVNILRLLYSHNTSVYTVNSVCTEPMPCTKGVRQGCPLSMVLFSVFMELLIRPVIKKLDGYTTSGGCTVKVLAYADDLCLISSDPMVLQSVLDDLGPQAQQIGLKFRASKCHAYSFCAQSTVPPTIHDQPIVTDPDAPPPKYLGVEAGLKVDQNPIKLFNSIVSDFDKIMDSPLWPGQKLRALKIFLLSKLYFPFRTKKIEVQLITSKDHQQGNGRSSAPGLAEQLMRRLKTLLQLPKEASNQYIHSSTKDGGCGVPQLGMEYAAMSLIQTFKLMNSADPLVKNLARSDLERCVAARLPIDSSVEAIDMVNYLNNVNEKFTRNGPYSSWTRCRWAVRHLRSLRVSFSLPDKEGPLSLNFLHHNKETPSSFGPWSSQTVTKCIRQSLCCLSADTLETQYKFQNRAMNVITESQLSSKCIYSNSISGCDWKFIHKARLQLLPTMARMSMWGGNNLSPLCRRCGKENETPCHVLNMCPMNMPMVTKRHNAVLNALVDHIGKAPVSDRQVLVDQQYPGCGSIQRVDLVVQDPSRKTIDLVDIKCTYETSGCFDQARRRNEEKYRDQCDRIAAINPGYTVRLDTICVGSLGAWDTANEPVLRRLGFNRKQFKAVAHDLILKSIHGSRNTWVTHQSGIPQTY